MKKLFLLFLVLSVVEGLFPTTTYANGAGLPAFFNINGKLAESNPLQTFGITASSFLIPQDNAPENYVVNEPINFIIDETPLEQVIPKELLQKTKYYWDFGDGNKAEGLTNTHTYTKSGSYILILTINVYTDQTSAPTQFIDSFFINILPNKEYKELPKAVITVNDQEIKDSYIFEKIDFTKSVIFDATKSKSPNKIVQYIWNFGDGQTSTQPIVSHTYAKDAYFETVVLRVKDSNGFISDSFVGLGENAGSPSPKKEIPMFLWILPFILLSLLIIIGILLRVIHKRK